MQVYLKTLGCRLNEAELESWGERFQQNGHALTREPEAADILVINTCAVTRAAVKKSRQLIRRARRNNPAARLVVSGCYASLEQTVQTDIHGIDLLVKNRDKDQLVDIVINELELETPPAIATEPGETGLFKRGRNRAFIKIQDGCRYRCTFCIVTVARGDERSRTPAHIINDINQYHQQGIQEAVLTGVHVGGYGSDIDSNLYRLVKTVLNETDIPRLRLASVEPWDLHDDFFSLFENKRLMPHIHLPLQSGSDTVLKRMARRCRTADFSKLINRARQSVKHFNVTTDIIVGFPGETETEWNASLDFIQATRFSHIHIFTYSPHTGTRAAALDNQIGKNVKRRRSKQLHQIAHNMHREFLHSQIGQQAGVLWEMQNADQAWSGYTENFTRVETRVNENINLENKITPVTMDAVADNNKNCTVSII